MLSKFGVSAHNHVDNDIISGKCATAFSLTTKVFHRGTLGYEVISDALLAIHKKESLLLQICNFFWTHLTLHERIFCQHFEQKKIANAMTKCSHRIDISVDCTMVSEGFLVLLINHFEKNIASCISVSSN